MKVYISGWHTDGFPTDEEVVKLCKPGEGADTCVWLVAGGNGFQCTCLHKNWSLMERFDDGLTIAKRDGCDFMNNFNPVGLDIGVHEVDPFA